MLKKLKQWFYEKFGKFEKCVHCKEPMYPHRHHIITCPGISYITATQAKATVNIPVQITNKYHYDCFNETHKITAEEKQIVSSKQLEILIEAIFK